MTRTSKATETKTGRKPAGMDAMEGLIPLEDDCMFTAVMRNRDACTGFLEALFGGRWNRSCGSRSWCTARSWSVRIQGCKRRIVLYCTA